MCGQPCTLQASCGHKTAADVVSISSPLLGTLVNVVRSAEEAEDWSFGIRDLMRNLAARGLLDAAAPVGVSPAGATA